MDLFISIIAIIILSPVFVILTIFIKSGSKGEIIFKQERIGFKNEPFQIYKFRSMYADSEKMARNFLVSTIVELPILEDSCAKPDLMKLPNSSMS